ncbi:Bacteriophage Gp15 protein [Peptoniphilus asaccharolyticus DSM 20463]|uniref:Bacteriophage Gp15 protein n=1 Tax=Peptoniphilus asaccharolyticus DSM 20463 TaxID=573058 RepID=A0A1W1UZ04_PEPAS|nr:bacteriophage Gp15 family protein [Peptoniphilus asaccharolyticus]MBL7575367.1 bacteriophage Gp15 family protein [Peptoniphilus asaccharolyticus]SMB86296.1 Bacteriophage Gp15 protein [Peptoniphilus asaccharolyticus DSM 20463]
MNLLIDGAPKEIYIDSLKYNINYDFRYGLLFEELMNDTTISDSEKLTLAVKLYLENQYVENYEEAITQIFNFYLCGETPRKTKKKKRENPVFSYEEDAGLIFAAFKEVYNIDLVEDKIHWWKFRALFDALPDTCQFRKVVGYRAIEINQNMTDSQKKFYKEMKKIYALEDKRTLEEKEADFANALFG